MFLSSSSSTEFKFSLVTDNGFVFWNDDELLVYNSEWVSFQFDDQITCISFSRYLCVCTLSTLSIIDKDILYSVRIPGIRQCHFMVENGLGTLLLLLKNKVMYLNDINLTNPIKDFQTINLEAQKFVFEHYFYFINGQSIRVFNAAMTEIDQITVDFVIKDLVVLQNLYLLGTECLVQMDRTCLIELHRHYIKLDSISKTKTKLVGIKNELSYFMSNLKLAESIAGRIIPNSDFSFTVNPLEISKIELANQNTLKDLTNVPVSQFINAIIDEDNEEYIISQLYEFKGTIDDIEAILLEIDRQYSEGKFNVNQKLMIFKCRLFSYKLLSQLVTEYCPKWLSFLHTDITMAIQNYIYNRKIEVALLLWRRHNELENLIGMIPTFLFQIPLNLPVGDLILIAKELIYTAYKQRSVSLLEEIEVWEVKVTDAIEANGKAEEALQFLKAAEQYPIIEYWSPVQQINNNEFIAKLQLHSQSSIREQMRSLRQDIEDILFLNSNFQMKTNLAEYLSISKKEIMFRLLDQVHAPELFNARMKILKKYSAIHDIVFDDVMLEYSELLMQGDYAEYKLLEILPMIGPQMRSKILLAMMRRSSIPWSAEIDKEIQNATNYIPITLIPDYEEQLRLMELKKMLLNYGIEQFNVSDVKMAGKLVPYLVNKVESDSALGDSLLVAEAYSNIKVEAVVGMRLKALLRENCMEKFEELIKTFTVSGKTILNKEQQQKVLKELSIWIKLSNLSLNMLKGGQLCALEMGLSPIGYERAISLYDATGILVVPDDLDCPELLFKRALADSNDIALLYKLAEILELPQTILLQHHAYILAQSNDLSGLLDICRELVEIHSAGNLVAGVIDGVLERGVECILGDNMFKKCGYILEISRLILRVTSPDEIEKDINRVRQLTLLYEIVKVSDLGLYNEVSSEESENHKRLFQLYQEFPLVCSGVIAASKVFSLFKAIRSINTGGKGKQKKISIVDVGLDLATFCFESHSYQNCLLVLDYLEDQAILLQETISQSFVDLKEKAIFCLLENIYLSENIDFVLALGCMNALPMELANTAFKHAITNAGKNYSRLNSIARVGAMMGSLWKERNFKVNCMDLVKHSRWLLEFNVLDIPVEESKLRVSKDGGYQKTLIPYFLLKTGGDLEASLLFADEYNIGHDYVYRTYIQQTLFLATDNCSRDFYKLEAPIALIANLDLLFQNFKLWFERICPYDYECLQFLNRQMVKLQSNYVEAKKNILIIDILKGVKRVSVPDETEIARNREHDVDLGLNGIEKDWKTSWSQSLHYQSERIDFHALRSQPFEVLSKELNEDTFTRLIPIVQILDISADKFYEYIINQKIEILKESTGGIVFNDFKIWLSKIKGFELAVRLTVFVAGNFPRGIERIAAYKLALAFAERWLNSLRKEDPDLEKAETGCTKIKSMLQVSETELLLQTNGLRAFDAYATKPNTLITQLLTPNQVDNSIAAVVHQAADDVAKRYAIDLDKLKLMLLQRLLIADAIFNEIEQERIVFLLYGKYEWGVMNLTAFSKLPASKISTSARIKAISTIFRLEILLGNDSNISDLKLKLKHHMYLSEFEALKITQQAHNLESCDKLALVRSLLVTVRNELAGLRLICKLSYDHNISDPDVWTRIIEGLLKKDDHEFIAKFLSSIDSSSELLAIPLIRDKFREIE